MYVIHYGWNIYAEIAHHGLVVMKAVLVPSFSEFQVMFACTKGQTKPWNGFCMFVVLLTEAVCMSFSVLVLYFFFDVLCYDK